MTLETTTVEKTKSTAKNAFGISKEILIPFILVTSLFFMWGVANNLNDILIKQFKKSFLLSDLQTSLVQSAFYLGYFFMAMPAAALMKKFGYKTGIIIGLLFYALGAFLFYPAAQACVYGYFLTALFVLACGLSFLETASNSYITVLGPAESSERRLNLSQAFNPIGAITGVIIGRTFIFSGIEKTTAQLNCMSDVARQTYLSTETRAVQMPYVVIGCVVLIWAIVILCVHFPKGREAEDKTAGQSQHKASFKDLFKQKHFILGVLAQFCYVGAQVGIWSFMIRYSQHNVPGTPEKIAADYLTLTLVLFMFGRFVGTALMKFFKPNNIMSVFSSINVILTLFGIFVGGQIGLWALIISSFFMSIMFPTIFALSLKGLGENTKLGSSWLIMAIIGGAAFPALMGLMSDLTGKINYGYVIPCLCFIYVFFYASKLCKSGLSEVK